MKIRYNYLKQKLIITERNNKKDVVFYGKKAKRVLNWFNRK